MLAPLAAFQILSDINGDLYMVPGYAAQPSTGALVEMELNRNTLSYITGPFGDGLQSILPARPHPSFTFVGGSGRNLELISSVSVPRLLMQVSEDVWDFETWRIEKTSATTADLILTIGLDAVVAQMTSGSAPVGTYNSTATGATVLNGGTAFSVTVDEQFGAFDYRTGGGLTRDAGTFPEGDFNATGAWSYQHATDALATITVASDGTAVLYYDGVAVATRDGGLPLTPGGVYVANATGEDDFNSGSPWQATVEGYATAAVEGVVYMQLTLDTGTIDTLKGPFYAATIPAQSGDDYYIPIAKINELGLITQLHTGLILWP